MASRAITVRCEDCGADSLFADDLMRIFELRVFLDQHDSCSGSVSMEIRNWGTAPTAVDSVR